MERKFKMYSIDVDGDGSEFKVVWEVNGKVEDEEVVYSFDDVLGISYDFFKKNCEKYGFDSRRDEIEVNLRYVIG